MRQQFFCNWTKKTKNDCQNNHPINPPQLIVMPTSNFLKMGNSIIITIILFAFTQLCFGQTLGDFQSRATGNWNSYLTWQIYKSGGWSNALPGDPSPTSSNNVTIQNSHKITLNVNGYVRTLTINSTATLIGGSKELNVYGNFINGGTFTCQTSTIAMKGTDAQNIGGTTKFYYLTIGNSTSPVTADHDFDVSFQMKIEADCFFNPGSLVAINSFTSGTLTGAGTAMVTAYSYFSQYRFTTYSVDNVEYAGTEEQLINAYSSYNVLIINNGSGCRLVDQATCQNLNISTGTLTVIPGGTIEVIGNTLFGNPECLVLQSDSSNNTASFVFQTFSGSGTVRVERFMSISDNWHLYSSPINDQSIHDFIQYNPEIPDLVDTTVTPNVVIGVGMRDYNTALDIWNPYFVYGAGTPSGNMGSGKGFSIRTIDDGFDTGYMNAKGTPNPNTVSITLNTTGFRWNCIGNPFTCAIDLVGTTGFLPVNSGSIDPSFQAAYIWEASSSSYIPANSTTSITSVQIGQGFFVKAIVGGGSVTFNKGMQAADPNLSFKAAKPQYPSIKIILSGQTLKSSTEIKFVPNTTKGLDPGYDAGMLKAHPDFALYSKLLEDNTVDFTLQCLPDQNYDQYVIPIGIDVKAGGELTFTAETVNLPSGCQVLLEDRTTKRFTRLDLKDAKYTAYVSPDTKGTGRFFLHTSNVISSDQPLENPPFKVYTIGTIVYINGEVSDNAKFFLYSVNGKQLMNFKAESQVLNQFDVSEFPVGIYILTIDDKNQKKSIKFVTEN